jgi:hypothetical protein
MNIRKVERRSEQYRNGQGEKFDATVVRHGLILKLEGNTVSAIEYMHNRGVPVETIERVLSSTQLRDEDKLVVLSYSQKQR